MIINKLINIAKNRTIDFIKKSVPNFDPNFFSTRRQLMSPSGSFMFDNPYEQSVWIYAANKKISNSVSQSPYLFIREDNDQKEIISHDDPLNLLFDNPNPMMSRQELIQSTEIYLGLDGEAFWILDRDNPTDLPEHIWSFRKNFFRPEIDKTTGLVKHWNFEGIPKVIAVENIIQFKYFNPDLHYAGLAPWKAASLASEQDYFASNYNTNFFKQGAKIGGFLEVEDALDDEQYDRLLTATEDRHVGHTKAHRLMLLEGGTKFKEAKLSQKDMEFIETKKISKSEILAAYGTNPVVLGDFSEVKSEAGVKVILKDFWTSVVIPNQDYIENKVFSEFLSTYDPSIRMFFDNSDVEVLQEDFNILLERAKKLFEMGYSVNDINTRLNLGMPELENGNVGYLPGNLFSIDSIANPEIEANVSAKKSPNLKKKITTQERDRQREHEKIQDKSEIKFRKVMRKYYNDQEKRVIEKLENIPEMTLIANYKSKAIEDELFDDNEEIKELIAVMSPLWEETYGIGFEIVAADLGLDLSFRPLSSDFLKFQKFKVTKIAPSMFETVKVGVQQALKDGLAERETIREIAGRIKKVYDIADNRAITIARTESTSSLNAGRLDIYKDPEARVKKIKWITARDEHVRSSHVVLDGMLATPGQFFVDKNGRKTKLKHPGDNLNGASAGDLVNCRCTIIEDFGDLLED